jgi:hypothetical protein
MEFPIITGRKVNEKIRTFSPLDMHVITLKMTMAIATFMVTLNKNVKMLKATSKYESQ